MSRARCPSLQAVWVPGHPEELGHHVLGSVTVWLPGPAPALRDSRHLPEPYLAAQRGAGCPSVLSHGAQWLVVVGTSCPVGGKKKPFL